MRLFQRSIKALELNEMTTKQLARVIDVRSNFEFKQGNIKGTKNVPLEKLVNNPSMYIKGEDDYYIICQSGMRSRRAVSVLKKRGFNNLVNIKGGYITYAKIQNN